MAAPGKVRSCRAPIGGYACCHHGSVEWDWPRRCAGLCTGRSEPHPQRGVETFSRAFAAECEALGGRALAVPTDVTDAEAVRRLAAQADDAFGGVDVWINNAGTGVFGAYQDADIALHRRTIEVNLLGTMHGAFAVLPVFLRQKRGILINNISLGGWAPTPFAAAYTASKFGLRGFTASLRQELGTHANIHVCGVFPAMVDTPGFVHGANVSGKRLDPGPLLYQSEDVAQTFLDLVRMPRDEVAVGWPARRPDGLRRRSEIDRAIAWRCFPFLAVARAARRLARAA